MHHSSFKFPHSLWQRLCRPTVSVPAFRCSTRASRRPVDNRWLLKGSMRRIGRSSFCCPQPIWKCTTSGRTPLPCPRVMPLARMNHRRIRWSKQIYLSVSFASLHRAAPVVSRRTTARSVQLDIQSALRRNPKTRSGNYRAVLDLWIDSARVIQRTALLQSTGQAERDAAVTAALQGLTTSRPPPANAPQPVRVVIVVKSPQ
jgi:hypothetical protein